MHVLSCFVSSKSVLTISCVFSKTNIIWLKAEFLDLLCLAKWTMTTAMVSPDWLFFISHFPSVVKPWMVLVLSNFTLTAVTVAGRILCCIQWCITCFKPGDYELKCTTCIQIYLLGPWCCLFILWNQCLKRKANQFQYFFFNNNYYEWTVLTCQRVQNEQRLQWT